MSDFIKNNAGKEFTPLELDIIDWCKQNNQAMPPPRCYELIKHLTIKAKIDGIKEGEENIYRIFKEEKEKIDKRFKEQ